MKESMKDEGMHGSVQNSQIVYKIAEAGVAIWLSCLEIYRNLGNFVEFF